MNNCTNTTGSAKFTGRKRVIGGAAAVMAAGALVGMTSQGAFAGTPTPPPSATSSASTTAGGSQQSAGNIQADISAILHGHIDGTKAHALASILVNDSTVFSLLPSNLQSDVTALASSLPAARATDATKIGTKALSGEYGTLIQNLAKEIRNTPGNSAHSLVGGVTRDLNGGGKPEDQVARIAVTVTDHEDLASSLPAQLTTDLRALAVASVAERDADVQKIEATALGGGYGLEAQKIAGTVAASIVFSH